ncbi:TonB-dependent siderophore receptor [Oleiharenicola lentus]|uniref:TonB-dependent siderophore receptor n=1 Tax=Oleiharenicola lentus TaxID=2508720 RepID=UPI003F6662DD
MSAALCLFIAVVGRAEEARRFDIPGSDAVTALEKFVDQSGFDVVYTIADLGKVQTRPVVGALLAREALGRMLAGTALTILQDEVSGAFMIRKASAPSRASQAPDAQSNLPPMDTKKTIGGLLGSLLIGVTSLDAQVPPSPPTQPDDEVIALSVFKVTTNPTNEYLAADSITGTRVASKLNELPFAVTAITSEFMNDFVLLELSDQLATVSGFSPNENENSYQLRGFASSTTLVDGFRWIGASSASFGANTDRIEVIKGSVASIYGQISPGGVVNTITRKPQARPESGVSVLAGSLNNLRTSIYSTGRVGNSDKFFYRADVSYQQRDYVPRFADFTQYYGSLQFAYRQSKDTNINVSASIVSSHKHTFVGLPLLGVVVQDPYRPIGRTYTHITGLAYDLFDFSYQGPDSYQDSRTKNVRALIEHQFNRVFSLRAAFSGLETEREVNRLGSNTYAVATKSIQLTPLWQDREQTGVAGQVDTLAVFSTGKIDHKLLFTLDYNQEQQRDYDLQMSAANAQLFMRQRPLLPANPIYGYAMYRDNPAAYNTVTADEDVGYSVFGAFLSERASLFKNRLIVMLGGRYDKVYTDPVTAGVTGKNYSVSDFTYQAGATFRLTSGISLYLNRSTSFNPQAVLDLSGNPLPNEQGSGHEFGVKMTLIKDRLNLSLNRFQVDRKNIAQLLVNPDTLIEDFVLTTHERSNGYEADINWQVSDSFQLLGGYGFTEARALNNASAAYLTGLNVLKRVPKHNLGLAARYKFPGAFKGLIATANVRWLSESILNVGGRTITPTAANPINNIRFANGLLPYPNSPEGALVYSGVPIRVSDGRDSVYNGASVVWDFGLGYTFKAKKRFTHKVRVNVKNAFDERYVYGAGNAGDPRGLFGEYSLKF